MIIIIIIIKLIIIKAYPPGDVICPECGLVVGDRIIDVGSEWRTFSNEKDSKDNSRVGAAENTLLSGSDLTTNITVQPGGSQYDENGRLMYNNRRNVCGVWEVFVHVSLGECMCGFGGFLCACVR